MRFISLDPEQQSHSFKGIKTLMNVYIVKQKMHGQLHFSCNYLKLMFDLLNVHGFDHSFFTDFGACGFDRGGCIHVESIHELFKGIRYFRVDEIKKYLRNSRV